MQEGRLRGETGIFRGSSDSHWASSDANYFEAEQSIDQEDGMLEYPQSGSSSAVAHNLQHPVYAQPSMKRFRVRSGYSAPADRLDH